MSEVTSTVATMFHPWRALRELAHIDVTWKNMDGVLGATDGRSFIVMNPHQSQRQRRCTLAHELAHIELGHINGATDAQEAEAREHAARRLISLERLMDAFRWADNLSEVAYELWVDEQTLMDRIDTLTADERQGLVELHATIEQGA